MEIHDFARKYIKDIPNLPAKAAANIIVLYLITSVHHIYGGIIYGTNWRIHGTLFTFIPLIISLASLYIYVRAGNRIALGVYGLMSHLWVLIIGLWEGGYNHVIKNIVYFSGASVEHMRELYPADLYDALPNNFFFELTGILTFVFGMIAGWYTLQLFHREFLELHGPRQTEGAKS